MTSEANLILTERDSKGSADGGAMGDDQQDSLFAVSIDSSGQPFVQAEFLSVRDKLAIIALAEACISSLKQQALVEAMNVCPSRLAA